MKTKSFTKTFARDQIERLAHMFGAPKTTSAWEDYVTMLTDNCRDADHCAAVISGYVDQPRTDEDGNPRFPSVYDLRQLCLAGTPARGICPICSGDGFVPDAPAFRNGVRYERVKRCQCDRQASFEDRATAGEYRPPTDAERYGSDEIFSQAAEKMGL